MPIFDQDETSSGDIFEQQRRRKRKNDAVDSEGTSYNQTGSQRGPGKNTGGALSPGAFVTERAKKERMVSDEKATPTFYTSSGSFRSSRDANRDPRKLKLSKDPRFHSTITTGTGRDKQTFGFRDKYAAARASRAVARRNKTKQSALRRLKQKTGSTETRDVFDLKSDSTPGGDTMTNQENQGLSFGEKVLNKASTRFENGEKKKDSDRISFLKTIGHGFGPTVAAEAAGGAGGAGLGAGIGALAGKLGGKRVKAAAGIGALLGGYTGGATAGHVQAARSTRKYIKDQQKKGKKLGAFQHAAQWPYTTGLRGSGKKEDEGNSLGSRVVSRGRGY